MGEGDELGGVRPLGGGRIQIGGNQGVISQPLYSCHSSPRPPPTMKAGAWTGCQGSMQWPVNPPPAPTTLQSHVSVNSSLSQLTKHRVPLVLQDDRCAVRCAAALRPAAAVQRFSAQISPCCQLLSQADPLQAVICHARLLHLWGEKKRPECISRGRRAQKTCA